MVQPPLLDSINKIAKSNKPLSKLYKLIFSNHFTNSPHILLNKWVTNGQKASKSIPMTTVITLSPCLGTLMYC